MTPLQVHLVKASFARVVPIRHAAAEMFYNRLFELDPSLRPLFKTEQKLQGEKLMKALATIVGALQNLQPMLSQIDALGRNHSDYGVEERHYATVAEALIWTFEQGLGKAFTPETRVAWQEAYKVLSARMIAAAARPEAA